MLPPGIVQVYESFSTTLNWNFSLSEGLGLGFSIKFNAVTIVSIGKDGSLGSSINAQFQERFSVSATPQSASLSISPVTLADDKSNGEFICELPDAKSVTWKRAIHVQVIGKIESVVDFKKGVPLLYYTVIWVLFTCSLNLDNFNS